MLTETFWRLLEASQILSGENLIARVTETIHERLFSSFWDRNIGQRGVDVRVEPEAFERPWIRWFLWASWPIEPNALKTSLNLRTRPTSGPTGFTAVGV